MATRCHLVTIGRRNRLEITKIYIFPFAGILLGDSMSSALWSQRKAKRRDFNSSKHFIPFLLFFETCESRQNVGPASKNSHHWLVLEVFNLTEHMFILFVRVLYNEWNRQLSASYCKLCMYGPKNIFGHKLYSNF